MLSRMQHCKLQCKDIYSRFGIESTRRWIIVSVYIYIHFILCSFLQTNYIRRENVDIKNQSVLTIYFRKYGTIRLRQDVIYRWYELMGENILSFRNRTLSLSLSINSFYSFNIEEYRLIGHNLKILQIKLSSFILSLHRFIVSSKTTISAYIIPSRKEREKKFYLSKASIYIEILSSRCWDTINARGKTTDKKRFRVCDDKHFGENSTRETERERDHKTRTISSCNEGFGSFLPRCNLLTGCRGRK